jgi:hypothetical protein
MIQVGNVIDIPWRPERSPLTVTDNDYCKTSCHSL